MVVSRTSSVPWWCVSHGGVTNFKSSVVSKPARTSSFTELATNFTSLVASMSAKNVYVVDAVFVGKELKVLMVSISVKIVESLVGSEQAADDILK